MTRCLVLAGPSTPAADDALEQAARVGADAERVDVTAPGPALRAVARTLSGAGTTVVLVDGGLAVPDVLLETAIDRPSAAARALAVDGGPGDLRVRQHSVHSAGSSAHEVTAPDHTAVGILVVPAVAAPAAAAAIDAMADEADARGWTGTDVVALSTVALVRSAVPVTAQPVGGLPWGRPATVAEAASLRAELDGLDGEALRIRMAARADDGVYSTLVPRRLSRPLSAWASRHAVPPNAVTLVSFAVGLAAAAAFAGGTRPWLVAGALLLQASLVLDCVDGEVARATRRYSGLGAWLDASTDRVKEYLAYAGLAVGAARSGTDLWLWAGALVALQTFRHMTDYDFTRVNDARAAVVPRLPLGQPGDGAQAALASAVERSARANSRVWVRAVKHVVHFPIGERWLVISLTAALGGPVWTFAVMTVCTLVALAYVTAGRLLRTASWRSRDAGGTAAVLVMQYDPGPLLRAAGALLRRDPTRAVGGRAAWAVPPLLRLAELGAALALLGPAAPGPAFWWVFVVAFHHYDVLYRSLQGCPTPRWLLLAGLGWDGRTVVLVAMVLLGALAVALPVLLGYLAVLFVVVASVQWVVGLGGGSR